MKIAIADDEKLFCHFLKEYLDQQPDMRVVCVASNGADLMEKTKELAESPEIFLLDFNMQGPGGATGVDGGEATIIAVKERFPDAEIIILSTYFQSVFSGHMMRLGVAAFMPKDIEPDELKRVINTVHKQGYYFTPDQIGIMRKQISTRSPKPQLEEQLTEREIEILLLICQEYTSKEIGEKLFISKRTVDGHKSRLFEKTSAKNIAGLVSYAYKNGLVGD